jgi:hypothetical protein
MDGTNSTKEIIFIGHFSRNNSKSEFLSRWKREIFEIEVLSSPKIRREIFEK